MLLAAFSSELVSGVPGAGVLAARSGVAGVEAASPDMMGRKKEGKRRSPGASLEWRGGKL